MTQLDGTVARLESNVGSRPNDDCIKMDCVADEEPNAPPRSSFDGEDESTPQYYNDGSPHDLLDDFAKSAGVSVMAEDQLEEEPGHPVPPGEPAIPINHTTPAGFLLAWPSIYRIVGPHLRAKGIKHITEYPISHEQNRGPLIVYGRGEDAHPSYRAREIPNHGQLSMSTDWRRLGRLSPVDPVVVETCGILGSDINLDFSETKVRGYVASFQDNILNLHPIIQPRILQEWVRHFLDTLPPKSTQPKFANVKKGFAVEDITLHMVNETTSLKRKRSFESDGPAEVTSTPGVRRSGRLERSINNALILTILALGKICLHRDRVHDAVHDMYPLSHNSSMIGNGISTSPSQSSPPSLSSHSHSSGDLAALPSQPERGFQSRQSSIHGCSTETSGGRSGLKKNYEAIPGFEYFAFATDILGNYTGAYMNMKHVYALIFAGLYQGQLARPMESFAFIHQASHKLQVIMRP